MSNSSTKCPICNTQNDPDATACRQCGFGFGLTQTMWPDYNLDDAPSASEPPYIPPQAEPPKVPAPPPEPAPTPPKDETPALIVEPPRPSAPLGEVVETVDNDALACAHIADGVRAMRAGSPGQAQLEFEQALDLTSDPAIARSAQKRLRELSGELDEAARLPVHLEAPPAQPAASLPGNLGWISALRLGLIIGFINSVLTGCGAVFCVGFVFAPLFGLAAGWRVAKQAQENGWPTKVAHALLAGALVGLGGGLGQLIGYPVWLANLPDQEFDSTFQCLTCCLGTMYIAITLTLSALGWKFKTSRKS